ncbi:MAG: CDP-alcohol phosphatidyltransferase family protein, partial [Acidobacteria bacterium]|nr:CDP-alcohol phosphatidyltransferase family protein [Acidobacteriota bacterium]
ARAFTRWLGRTGVRPNAVSIAGVVVALAASVAFYLAPEQTGGGRAALLLVAAASIQLRLLCNLLDRMLAVEEGFKSKIGDIYNDLPDRVADVFILVGAGYSVRYLAFGTTLGWAAAVLALFTAYVRVLGGSLELTQHFIGPMAKQHRMFTLTVVTLVAAVEALLGMPPRAIRVGLAVIVAGSIVTAVRRTWRIAGEMEAR